MTFVSFNRQQRSKTTALLSPPFFLLWPTLIFLPFLNSFCFVLFCFAIKSLFMQSVLEDLKAEILESRSEAHFSISCVFRPNSIFVRSLNAYVFS